jgi:hypothetical protein
VAAAVQVEGGNVVGSKSATHWSWFIAAWPLLNV